MESCFVRKKQAARHKNLFLWKSYVVDNRITALQAANKTEDNILVLND